MKLFAALGATVIGVKASNLGDWCRDHTTDEVKCALMKAKPDWNCPHDDIACYQDNWDAEMKTHNEAPPDFVTEEFLGGIEDDSMMKEILAEMAEYDKILEDPCFEKTKDGDYAFNAMLPGCEGQLTRSNTNGTDTPPKTPQQMGDALDGQNQLRRFVELKQLVSWLQPKDKRISRYCFYGCWCLPEGAHSFIAGEGHPVDLVDRACQLFWFCYQCAKQEMTANVGGKQRTCDPEKTKYTFRFKYNKNQPNNYKDRDIVCKDNWYNPMDNREKWKSNCAKAFCECDRGIAIRLYKSWKHWDKSRHRIWSQRVTQCPRKTNCENMPIVTAKQRADREACLKSGCLFIVSERCLYGAGGANTEDVDPICCGVYEDDGSRFEMRAKGDRYGCCNHDHNNGFGDKLPWNGAWYNKITQCCGDGQVQSIGDPSC